MKDRSPADEYRPLQDIVVDRLRRDILSGVYRDNERLVQDTLAASMGVSKPPVREALRRLENEGLVEVRPGYGAFVTRLSCDRAEELFMIRGLLEGLATRLAVQHLSDEHIERLEQLTEETANARDDLQRYLELNTEFHMTLYQAGGGELLCQMIRSLWSNIQRYFRIDMRARNRYDTVGDEHSRILAACKARDSEAAERAMMDHIENAKVSILNTLGDDNARRIR